MDICSEGHDSICHDDFRCPVCRLIRDYEVELEELRTERDTAIARVEKLESELVSAMEQVAEAYEERS